MIKLTLLLFLTIKLYSNDFNYYGNDNTYEKEKIEENIKLEQKKYEEKRNKVLQYDKFQKEVYDYKIKDFDFNSYEYAKVPEDINGKKNINEIAKIDTKEKIDKSINNVDLYKDLDYFKTYGFDNVKEVFVDEDNNNCNINDDFFVVNNSDDIKELKKCIDNLKPKLSGQYYFYGDVNDIMDFLAINNINIEKEFLFLFFANQNLEKTLNLLTYKSIKFLTIKDYYINSAIMIFPYGFLTEGKFYLKTKHEKEYINIIKEIQNIQKNNL